MFRKRVWLPFCVLLIIVMGCDLFFGPRVANRDPDFVNPTSTSTNPMFADGVPEHLQCPPELIGAYITEVDPEMKAPFLLIGTEIKEKWNPGRPLREIWPAFMATEKRHHANADPKRAVLSQAAGRVDWQFQLVLDFPEILLVLQEEDGWRFLAMHQVELGNWSPDFNRLTLPDGRTFRTDDEKRYEFTWSSKPKEIEPGITAEYSGGYGTGPTDAETIHINLDEVTDEELERLGGWNYNINPYTTGVYKLGDNK